MHDYSQEYLPKLQAHQPELLQRLELLVNIDSGSGQVQGINQIMTHLEQWLSALGFAVTLYEADALGYNLVARLKGEGTLRLLLVAHVSTLYCPPSPLTPP